MAYSAWTSTVISVNGVGIFDAQILNTNSYPIRTNVMIPVKKGDIITISSVSSEITADYKVRLRLYGIR